jgi:hypothetical protein
MSFGPNRLGSDEQVPSFQQVHTYASGTLGTCVDPGAGVTTAVENATGAAEEARVAMRAKLRE